MLTTTPLNELVDAFASATPTPGSGSAAALAGAIGAALLAMVAGMPGTKHNTPEERASLDAARAELTALQRTLVDLVDRDAAAYDSIASALRKPKKTAAQRAERQQAIQDATRVATEVPLETMRACSAAMTAGQAVGEAGNPAARTDIAVAVQSLTTGLQAAWFKVEISIGDLKDAALVDRITRDLKAEITSSGMAQAAIYQSTGLIAWLQGASIRAGFQHGRPPADA